MNRCFNRTHATLLALGFFAAASLAGRADVKMPAIFGDHMVLQQDGKIPVWGWADAGEKVKVSIGPDAVEATTGADGQWRVDLPALPTNPTGLTMTVTGKNTLTFQDVLVGDVWLASGQSNMELKMSQDELTQPAIATATNPQLRLFLVTRAPGIIPKSELQGAWVVCSPATVADFSAVAYFFGQDLQESLKRPIGLIGSYWGGTFIQSWIGIESLRTLPETANGAANVQQRVDAFPKDTAAQKKLMADYKVTLADWQTNVDTPYRAALTKWDQDTAAAKAAGQPLPPQPKESAPHPNSPDGEPWEYTVLFNGMINPLIPYAIKGVLWYQGESNADGPEDYGHLLKLLITDWRSRWKQGDFPFLVVQLPSYGPRLPNLLPDANWTRLREGQTRVSHELPNVGLAITLDLGDGNIHPPDKLDVGKRLAAVAKHVAYGQDLVYTGPTYDSMTVEGNKIRVKYHNTGTGLAIGTAPWFTKEYPPPSTTELAGFTIAGADKNWVRAKAVIDGNDVLVSSDQVPSPVAVRYAWETNPETNLYNKEGFPAAPFRSDDWPFVPPPVNK
jgi:sialate O-acetylesterase